MAREFRIGEFLDWEPLDGAAPDTVLDEHPGGDCIVFQVWPLNSTTERAAVWDGRTRKICWNPGNANAMCWIEGGRELLVLEEEYVPAAERPEIFVTPLQSDYRHYFRRVSWPGQETIEQIEVRYPTGWVTDVMVVPGHDRLGCFVWEDQCEGGIEFVSWNSGPLRQLEGLGYFGEGSNRIRGPAFSADGSALAMSYGPGVWWEELFEEEEGVVKRDVGFVVWGRTLSGEYQRIDLEVEVEIGWQPEDPEDMVRNELLGLPEFVSNNEIRIFLPTGEERLLYFGS
jgi:hypothetical protein